MIRSLLACYRNHFRYAFMVAGVLYLGLILFLVGLVEGFVGICGENVRVMFEQIVEILNRSFAAMSYATVREIPQIWSDILRVIREGTAGFGAELTALFSGLLFLLVVTFSCAKSVTLFYLRHESQRVGFLKGLFSVAFRTAVSLFFLGMGIWLCTVRLYAVWFVVAVWLFTKAIGGLVVLKISRETDLPWKRLFGWGSIWRIQCLYLLNAVVTVLCALLLALLMNLVVAVVVLLPFVVYFSVCVEAKSAEIAACAVSKRDPVKK